MSLQAPSKAQVWGGRVASGLVIAGLVMSAIAKISHQPGMVQNLVSHLGFVESSVTPIGAVEILSSILYAIPKTTVLGAVLLTGYLGGAVAAHVRIGEPFVAPLVLGILVWVGLFLRDPQIRALLPLHSASS
jgi:DoxX-like family